MSSRIPAASRNPELSSTGLSRLRSKTIGTMLLIYAAAVACLVKGAHAQTVEGDVFTVANYPVQAEARDAVMAKQQALADGQQAAFTSLLKRLVPVTRYADLKNLPADRAGDYLDGVTIANERNSRTFYEASLKLTFRDEPVRQLLDDAGIPYVDTQAEPVTVVLAYRPPDSPAASPNYDGPKGSEFWRSVWLGLDLTNALSPVRLAAIEPGLPPEAIRAVLAGQPDGVQQMARAYGVPRVVLAIIQPDPAAGRLQLWLAGQDAVGQFAIQRDLRFAPEDFEYTVELAAVISLGVLEGRWKAVTEPAGAAALEPTGAAAGPSAFQVFVQFQSLADWNRLRGAIESAPGVRNVEISGLSTRDAVVSLSFRGGASAFATALSQRGLTVSPTADGNLIVQ